ncbi:hypothetical protein [Rhizobium sp. SYY.PMSO]|uniref:hypothetical protein n=1 Tax=Rhizobium sp. SYY.PMSO TaxID=3382192 RepID=UPI000DDE697A
MAWRRLAAPATLAFANRHSSLWPQCWRAKPPVSIADLNETNIIALYPTCSGLNEQMPNNLYLAIFANQPQQWGFRGDPYLWRLLATKLAGIPDAANGEAAIETIYRVFTEITGEHLDIAGDFRLDGIPEHGMSGGLISGETWRGLLIPLLRSRAESYFNGELS